MAARWRAWFVEFMVDALTDALEQALAQDGGVSGGVNLKLDALDHRILALCGENPTLTQGELAAQIGKPLRTIQRRIQKLKQNHLRRVGSDKAGHWEVVRD